MSDESSILGAQTQAMIARLRRYQSDQIGAVLDRGHANAKAVVSSAFADARASVTNAVQRERRRREAEALKTRARAETRSRLESQLRVGDLLTEGWDRLPEVLSHRWRDASSRRQWWQGAIAEACRRLLGDQLTIEYAPGPSPAELDEMAAACGERPTDLQCVAALQAGIRISSNGACLDASAASLRADRDGVQSLLLATYQALESDDGAQRA